MEIQLTKDLGNNTYELLKSDYLLNDGNVYFFGRKNPNGTIGGSKGVVLETETWFAPGYRGKIKKAGYRYVIRTEKPIFDVDKIMMIADPYDRDKEGVQFIPLFEKLKNNKNV